ncbi:MAG: ribonuclease III [Scytolyngbya sp. HA4215-MV1]|jgi:ribonuclease-3|nr:ribonuclease III [Scytolyngbya sp. HA4215-MV1]
MSSLSYPPRQQQLHRLVQKLGVSETALVQWTLVDLALIHPSFSAEGNYEQLEFIGDAVLRVLVAEFLFETYPELSVGEFAAIRSILVSDRTLAQLAEGYRLDHYLLMSESALADQTGKQSRLADAFEALVGALYLSTHTLALIRPWLDSHLQRLTTEIRTDPARKNYKAALQEWTQAHFKSLPEYRVQETGQIHGDAHRFTAEVWFQEKCLGQGTGRSIKLAEQAAAQFAFLAIREQASAHSREQS